MPKGVYKHDPTRMDLSGLEKGRRDPAVRARAVESFRANVDQEFRDKMSAIVKKQWTAERRASHAEKIRRARNFKGGNGTTPVATELMFGRFLEPAGFVPGLVVRTKGHGTVHSPPRGYKVDLGHPRRKLALEIDGPVHKSKERQGLDRKKTEVLEALGWRVFRLVHK